MKIQVVFLLLGLFCSAVLTQTPAVVERYKKFINQHVKKSMTEGMCDAVIGHLDISETGSKECKETNTFIAATTGLIKPVCDKAGETVGTLRRSLNTFPIIKCTLSKGTRHPHCKYRGKSFTRRILISCEEGVPVHYGGDQ